MVKFGTMILPHVLSVPIMRAWEEIEHEIPDRDVPSVTASANLGRSVMVSGEIREETIDAAKAKIDEIRALCDGVARILDLEDGETPTFSALLTDPEYDLEVGKWFSNPLYPLTGKFHIPYAVSLLEVA